MCGPIGLRLPPAHPRPPEKRPRMQPGAGNPGAVHAPVPGRWQAAWALPSPRVCYRNLMFAQKREHQPAQGSRPRSLAPGRARPEQEAACAAGANRGRVSSSVLIEGSENPLLMEVSSALSGVLSPHGSRIRCGIQLPASFRVWKLLTFTTCLCRLSRIAIFSAHLCRAVPLRRQRLLCPPATLRPGALITQASRAPGPWPPETRGEVS